MRGKKRRRERERDETEEVRVPLCVMIGLHFLRFGFRFQAAGFLQPLEDGLPGIECRQGL